MNPELPDDAVDRALRTAGDRLRDSAPTDTDAATSFATRSTRAMGAGPRRSAWPAVIAAGLAAATVAGIAAYQHTRGGGADLAPATAPDTAPVTVPAPTTTVGAAGPTEPTAVTTPATCSELVTGPAIPQPATVVACIGAPTPDGDGTQAIVEHAAPDGGVRHVLVNSGDWEPTAGEDRDPIPLDGPLAVDGTDSTAFRLHRSSPGTTYEYECVLILDPQSGGWREVCDTAGNLPGDVITRVGTRLLQVHIESDSLRAGDALPTIESWSDCTAEDARGVVDAAYAPWFGDSSHSQLTFTELGCDGDRAAALAGFGMSRVGPMDGLILTFERQGDGWVVTDAGSGIEETISRTVASL